MNTTHHRSSLTPLPSIGRGLMKSTATLLCGALASTLLLRAHPAAAETVSVKTLHNFAPQHSGAAQALGAMIVGRDGNFYGTTSEGGSQGAGTVFRYTAAGKLVIIHSFNATDATGFNADGAVPSSTLVQGDDGFLYGTAKNGGAHGAGTIFKIAISGAFTTLHSFDLPGDTGHNADGAKPYAGLFQSYNGSFYGTTPRGGANGTGTIFAITPAGSFVNLHDFSARDANGFNTDGAAPYAGLVQSTDGNFYGAASLGGAHGNGLIFKFAPGGAVISLHDFTVVNGQTGNPDGANPYATLIEASNGNFYGTTLAGGTKKSGTVFRITHAGSLNVFHNFTAPDAMGMNADGAFPYDSLVEADNGILYGNTSGGGTAGTGTLFQIKPDGGFTSLHSFEILDATGHNFDGAIPYGGLVQGASGLLYGVTSAGGIDAQGEIYTMDFTGAVEDVRELPADVNTSGSQVVTPLVQGTDGALYGTALVGGVNGAGTVFKLTIGGTFTALRSFSAYDGDGHNADGALPQAGLVQGSDGNFYGTTYGSGQNGGGTAFRITPAGVLTPLHSFGDGASAAGADPFGSLVIGVDGNFYGTCKIDGASGTGTVFRLTRAGVVSSLHDFSFEDKNDVNADGGLPSGGLTVGSDGNFYGVTGSGGTNGTGTIFQLTRTGTLTTLHNLSAATDTFVNGDGYGSASAPIQAQDGNFYGTLPNGGNNGGGTIYVMSSDGQNFIVLHTFSKVDNDYKNTDGSGPYAGLIQGQDGYFYGTTTYGGANGVGTIFRITSFGTLTTLHDFTTAEGNQSHAALIQDSKGTFYGTTRFGGSGATGTVFTMVLPPAINSATTASAAAGQPFTYQITATNGPTAYGVLGLPPGVKVDSKTGLISGTPTTGGTKTLTLKVTNRAGNDSQTLKLTIASGAPVITSPGAATAQIGQPFSYQITATNGPTSYAVANLRPGLSLNKMTGLITGKPTGGAGAYLLTLKAINSYGTGTETLTLNVKSN